ncbi:hypothetical protein [Terribacillus sp. DMT04]|uniref:hypothetical protein n=1 Tax=Terribacillus sp. DMT04 TaxID=2850441 RepID=UPI001C2BE784|nr:hypothetical protein [Terribacillus sp. DMT04]QXE02274.1 hypothetical protein KS242_03300 [Terribacillus sp. DMT04]
MFQLIRDLSKYKGCSQSFVSQIVEKITPFADELHVDKRGNLIVRKFGERYAPKITLLAEVKEEVHVVTAVTDFGALAADANYFSLTFALGQSVQVETKKGLLQGVVVTSEAEEHAAVIDIGANTAQEAHQMGVETGNYVTCYDDQLYLGDEVSGRVVGKGLDNKIAPAIAIKLLQQWEPGDGEITVIFFPSQNKKLLLSQLEGEAAFYVGSVPRPSTSQKSKETIKLGSGVVIKVADKTIPINQTLKNLLVDLAIAHDIAFQLEFLFQHRYKKLSTKTPISVLNIPIEHLDQTTQVVSIKDLENTTQLIQTYLLRSKELQF